MKKSVLTLSILAMLSIPFAARASLVMGVLQFTGSAVVTTSPSFPGDIAFVGNAFTVGAAEVQEGGFVAFAGETGTIANLVNPPDQTDTPLDQPSFMTFDIDSNITITLTTLLSGTFGIGGCLIPVAAAGQECTPGPGVPDSPDQSPFNLANTSATASTGSFTINGLEHDSLTNTDVGVTAIFTEQSPTESYQEILTGIQGGGAFGTSFSATLATTPEPNTLLELMMGIGLVGIGLVYRKKLKRA